MLTLEQLDTIAWRLDQQRQSRSFASTDGGSLLRAVRSELHRRKNGPFTLAEAIASERPFRRKCWNDITVCERVYHNDFSGEFGGARGLCFEFTGGKCDEVRPDDITATDYELQEAQP